MPYGLAHLVSCSWLRTPPGGQGYPGRLQDTTCLYLIAKQVELGDAAREALVEVDPRELRREEERQGTTLAELWERYLDDYSRPHYKPNRLRNVVGARRLYVEEAFGALSAIGSAPNAAVSHKRLGLPIGLAEPRGTPSRTGSRRRQLPSSNIQVLTLHFIRRQDSLFKIELIKQLRV